MCGPTMFLKECVLWNVEHAKMMVKYFFVYFTCSMYIFACTDGGQHNDGVFVHIVVVVGHVFRMW